MKPVRIIFAGVICGIVPTAYADIASVQWVRSIVQSLEPTTDVQADWNQTVTTADDYIKNKPTIPSTAAEVGAVPTTRTVNGHALDSDVTVTKGDVGLGNVDNTSDLNKPISTATQTALDAKQDKLVAAAGATQNITGAGSVTVTQDANGKITITGAETDVSSKQSNLGGSGNGGKAVIASDTAGSVTYRAIDTTSGGTASSTDLITSGAVNAGLAGKVPTTTTVNGKALSSNISLTASDVGADASGTAAGLVGTLSSLDTTDKTNVVAAINEVKGSISNIDTGVASVAEGTTNGTIAVDGTDVAVHGLGAAAYKGVATSVADNEQGLTTGDQVYDALANKVAANAAITGATKTKITYDAKGLVTAGADLEVTDIPNLPTSKVNALTGYVKGSDATALATTDTLNAALSKLENQIDSKQAAGSYVPTTTTVNGNALSSNVTLDGADISLTGYTKPNATSAVSASDTINAAIGKLEAGILPVGTTSGTVAAGNDARFDSVPTTQPSGTPPTGRVWVWFN